ncbi:MAG: SOS response-associated peptidase [Caulobacterales bacterium]|nr:SOS response-associated peptidase [Caulobacterales bacterium]
MQRAQIPWASVWESLRIIRPADPEQLDLFDRWNIAPTANALIAPLHPRMPVIVAEADVDRWLDRSAADPSDLLMSYPGEDMAVWPVSRAVNDARNDGPELARAIGP